jgi:hypothetical protein
MYLIVLIVCKKKFSQSDCTNCKIITIEEEEKICLVGSQDCCQWFQIQ